MHHLSKIICEDNLHIFQNSSKGVKIYTTFFIAIHSSKIKIFIYVNDNLLWCRTMISNVRVKPYILYRKGVKNCFPIIL